MPLYTIVVDLGVDQWFVSSAIPTRPVAGDRLRYGDTGVELDVLRVTLPAGRLSGDSGVEVLTAPALPAPPREVLEERLSALRFRRMTEPPRAAA